MTDVAHIPGLGARFRCELYKGAMSPENCALRQRLARAGDERFGLCVTCQQGPSVTGQIQVTPCAAEGCRLAASPIHESGLCLTHARERKVEVKDIANKTLSSWAESVRAAAAGTLAASATTLASQCAWVGCDKPRGPIPTKVEGAEAYCAGHRGAIASKRTRAARAEAEVKAPAPLTVPDTEPMVVSSEATPEGAHPAPIADAPTLTRDPMLASIVPIADAADSASRDAKAAKVVAEVTIPDPAAVRAITDALNEMARRLRVYVAASKTLVVHARAAADELRNDGRICVGSRWHDILEEGAKDPLDYAVMKRILSENLADLRSCDVVLALTCRDAGRGVYGEIGRALEMGKLVVWSLERGGRCQDLADERVIEAPTDAQAIQIVRTLAAWRGAA